MSVEFVLLFPVLFLILYGLITYALIFSAQHTLSLAAAEGGRAALRYQRADTADEALALRAAAAQSAAGQSLNWLRNIAGVDAVSAVAQACASDAALRCLQVSVTYDYQAAPLVPRLLGPLSLPTPSQLSSEAVVQIGPMQLL